VIKRVIDTSELLGVVDTPEGEREVCACASAAYNEEARQLAVHLDSFLRTADLRAKEERFSAPWLPKPEQVTESVAPDEAAEVAKDVFHRWVTKVRQTTSSRHHKAL